MAAILKNGCHLEIQVVNGKHEEQTTWGASMQTFLLVSNNDFYSKVLHWWGKKEEMLLPDVTGGVTFIFSHLQLSTSALASSSRESGRTAVLQSVMLKKCFSRPIKVDWSHRGASMSKELRAILFVKVRLLAPCSPWRRSAGAPDETWGPTEYSPIKDTTYFLQSA